MENFEIAVRDYLQRCLRPNEPLEILGRVAMVPGTLLPPLPGSSPYAWVGLTRSRLISYHEGGRVVRSSRLPDLSRLEVNKHRGRWLLVWQPPVQLESSIAPVSKGFAKSVAKLIGDRDSWQPLTEQSTTVIVQHSETSGVPEVDKIMTRAGLSTETFNVRCQACGGWCGGLTEDGALETDECGACLRHITGVEQPS